LVPCLGGADTVTGSKYLVQHGGHSVLLDCGLFQGYKQLRLRNWRPLPVAPDQIDAVILTHAHHAAAGHQQRFRPDEARRVDPRRGAVLNGSGRRMACAAKTATIQSHVVAETVPHH
jgi:glyoxylase-like metal-dependent hydrolase (beta-lactamase superfamily II)